MKEIKGYMTFATNNGRSRHGLRKFRKISGKKRYTTRNEPMEAIRAFLEWAVQP